MRDLGVAAKTFKDSSAQINHLANTVHNSVLQELATIKETVYGYETTGLLTNQELLLKMTRQLQEFVTKDQSDSQKAQVDFQLAMVDKRLNEIHSCMSLMYKESSVNSERKNRM